MWWIKLYKWITLKKFQENSKQEQEKEREAFRVEKERKKEKKENFLEPNLGFKNLILVGILLSAKSSTTWYN